MDMYVLHFMRRHLRVHAGHALARPLVVRISSEMLCGRCYLEICLHSECHLHPQFAYEIGRLSIYFFVAAPSLVASHIENRCIDIGVAQKPSFAAGDSSHFMYQFPVPSVSKAELGREVSRTVCLDATYSFIGEIHGDAQAGIFDEEPLHLVHRSCMCGCRPEIRRIHLDRSAPLAETVQMLVDRAHAVLPQFLLPFRSRKRVGKHTPIAVKRHHLTGLLLNRHLRKQILHSRVNVRSRIFINVLDPVLVQVNPPLVVYLPVLRPELECRVRTGRFRCEKKRRVAQCSLDDVMEFHRMVCLNDFSYFKNLSAKLMNCVQS